MTCPRNGKSGEKYGRSRRKNFKNSNIPNPIAFSIPTMNVNFYRIERFIG
jgi:hypothetical protein